MASREQIERMLADLGQINFADSFWCTGGIQAGTVAVLWLLSHARDTVTAGKISEALGISTARVAVLLKKLAGKGLVTKERSPADARITIVRLTASGTERIRAIQDETYRTMGRVIDGVGEERMREFISIARDIWAVSKSDDKGAMNLC